MNTKKSILAYILSAMMALALLSGCQNNAGTAPDSAPKPAQPGNAGAETVELTMWVQSRGADLEAAYSKIVDAFLAENANVKINIEYISSNDLQAKVQAAVLAKNTPDILGDFIGRAGSYMNADLFVPLDDVFTADYKAKFYEGILNQGTKDGVVYMFPERVDYYVLNVNKTLFDEAGATDLLPLDGDRTWTRAEFETAMEAVSKNGVYGIGLWAASEQSDINTKILIEGGMGTNMYSDDFQTVVYDAPEAVQGLEWLCSLIEKGYASPNSANVVDDEVWMLYAQKTVAILPTTTEPLSWIKTQIADGVASEPFEIVCVQFPTADGKTAKTAAPMTGYGIFKNEENAAKIDAAKKFLKFLTESETARDIIQIYGGFPAYIENSDIYDGNPELSWVAGTMGNYVYDAGYASKGFADVRMVLYPEVQAAYAGLKTPEEAMADFTEAANSVLALANAG